MSYMCHQKKRQKVMNKHKAQYVFIASTALAVPTLLLTYSVGIFLAVLFLSCGVGLAIAKFPPSRNNFSRLVTYASGIIR